VFSCEAALQLQGDVVAGGDGDAIDSMGMLPRVPMSALPAAPSPHGGRLPADQAEEGTAEHLRRPLQEQRASAVEAGLVSSRRQVAALQKAILSSNMLSVLSWGEEQSPDREGAAFDAAPVSLHRDGQGADDLLGADLDGRTPLGEGGKLSRGAHGSHLRGQGLVGGNHRFG
jgi:hypothetical protein